jgi:hypothetical protein
MLRAKIDTSFSLGKSKGKRASSGKGRLVDGTKFVLTMTVPYSVCLAALAS